MKEPVAGPEGGEKGGLASHFTNRHLRTMRGLLFESPLVSLAVLRPRQWVSRRWHLDSAWGLIPAPV
jgi:hypothetical protein